MRNQTVSYLNDKALEMQFQLKQAHGIVMVKCGAQLQIGRLAAEKPFNASLWRTDAGFDYRLVGCTPNRFARRRSRHLHDSSLDTSCRRDNLGRAAVLLHPGQHAIPARA